VADNNTPEGRSRNRRVALTIESRAQDVLSEVPLLQDAIKKELEPAH
jgi:hypothetical protein